MRIYHKHIVLSIIRLFLMIFWLYVGLDKLWNQYSFYLSLLKQPFPDWWADVLVWGLPLAELAVPFLFVARRPRGIPYLLSALLMAIFTVYIGLGVAGLYAKRPCSCASIFQGMSWETHLVVNVALLGISLYGYYLARKGDGDGRQGPADRRRSNPTSGDDALSSGIRLCYMLFRKWFRRKFAVFPGRPVRISLNYSKRWPYHRENRSLDYGVLFLSVEDR